MKTVRVIYKLRIVEDLALDAYAEGENGPPTLEEIRHWEEENLKQMMADTEKSLGGKVTGVVVVEPIE